MDTLVVLNTCQHPLDPDPEYRPRRVKLEVFPSIVPTLEDPSFTVRPENERARQNTEDFYLLAQ
jgi:uncharacterized protein